jgi:hypothetical protein
LRSDDKVVEKAKRALAVALSLLEERGVAPAQVQAMDEDTQRREIETQPAPPPMALQVTGERPE